MEDIIHSALELHCGAYYILLPVLGLSEAT